MEIAGEAFIPAAQAAVWAALNDPDVLARALPGCRALEQTGAGEFTATLVAKVGPVSATFKGKVDLSDLDPPHGYTLSGRGQGGPAGFAKGRAKVRLEAEGEGTRLFYAAEVEVGGRLAAVGGRLIAGVAKSMADDFFSAFSRILAGGAGETAPRAVPAPEAGIAIPVPASVPTAALAAGPTRFGLLDRCAWLVAGAGIGTVATLIHLGRF